MSLINYVECDEVNTCKVFPFKCNPLCNKFKGYSCVGKEDKMDSNHYREISEEQLLKNDLEYENKNQYIGE